MCYLWSCHINSSRQYNNNNKPANLKQSSVYSNLDQSYFSFKKSYKQDSNFQWT